uniref:Uncharacterized protein n=1 Tax=Mastacembelus armatus TaxID=205130 RepID=A0A7N8WPQ3_9TELE
MYLHIANCHFKLWLIYKSASYYTDPFLWFQPGVSVLYCVPESKEPGLPQTNSATHQVKQVFTFPLYLRNTDSDTKRHQ